MTPSALVIFGDPRVEQAHAIGRGALLRRAVAFVRPGHAGNVEMGPGDALLHEALQELRRRDRAGIAAVRDVPHVGDVGVDHLVVFRPERQAPQLLADPRPRRAQLVRQRCVVAEQAGALVTKRHDDGAGQGRELDHRLRLELLLRVPHGVAQDQPALGIGVDDLDGLARHALDHVARPLGVAVRHVLDQSANAHDVGARLAAGQQAHRAGDGAGAAHVPFHVFHAAGGLQRDAAGVEAHALADQRHRLLRLGPVHPAHHQELRFALTALADGQQHVHAELLHLGLAQDLDLDAELGELAGAAGEFDGIEHVGGFAHQVAGEEHRADRGFEPLVGATRLGRTGHRHRDLLERILLLGLVLGLVLVEAVVAQLRAERDAGGDLARRQPAALHGIDDHGHGLLARRIGLGRDGAAERFRGTGIQFARLADAQEAQARDAAGLAQQGERLALSAGEAAGVDRPHDCSPDLLVDGLRARQELLVGGDEDRHVAREGLWKGHKIHFHSVPSLQTRAKRQFFAPATGRRKQRIACETRQIRGGVGLLPTVSVPALKTDMEMTSATLPRVSVVGLGKLGAPLAAVLASRGFTVTGLDVSKTLVDALNAGKMPIVEPQLNELIAANRQRLSATMDAGEAVDKSDASFVIVPTPSDSTGFFSNRFVLQAMQSLGKALRNKTGYHMVVITSTVMPGTTGSEIRAALEAASGRKVGPDLGLCYNPEFIALGSVVRDMLFPDSILIGESDAKAGDMLQTIYLQMCENKPPVQRMNFINAELTKISVNTYVTTKISYANMLADICDRLPGADVDAVTKALGADTRIGPKYLKGAMGYGGPCFPRDNVAFAALARKIGARADVAEATDRINNYQVDRLANLVAKFAKSGTRIALLGLSYKPLTPVVEESHSVNLAARLADAGYVVSVHDPLAQAAAVAMLGDKVVEAYRWRKRCASAIS